MANEQQALSFKMGITNVPSDATCDDNALEESLGMIYEDGEHRPIQKPKEHKTGVDGELVFVHTRSGDNRYIYVKDGSVYWNEVNESHLICSYTGELHVEAIHGTLVISDTENTFYALWKSDTYSLIKNIPEFHYYPKLVMANTITKPDLEIKGINFPLNIGENDDGEYPNPYKLSYSPKYIFDDGTVEDGGWWMQKDGVIYVPNCVEFVISSEVEAGETFQNAIIGAMEQHLTSVKENNAFTFPFWVRFAVELWDGSVTRQSAPILMWPSVRNGCCLRQTDNGNDPKPTTYSGINNWMTTEANAEFLHVGISCSGIDKGDLTDIIKSIKVYVSQEVRNCYLNENKWEFYCPRTKRIKRRKDIVAVAAYSEDTLSYYREEKMDYAPKLPGGESAGYGVAISTHLPNMSKYYRSFLYAKPKSDDEIKKELIETSVFYELCSIPFGDIDNKIDHGSVSYKVYTEQLMNHHALVNLTTLPQMPKDDFYSHSTIKGGSLFAYNSRLNIYGFTRKLFEGFDVFSSEDTNSYSFRIVVYVKGDEGEMVTFKDFYSGFAQGYFFYYPDIRASRAELYIKKRNGNFVLLKSINLKQHPYLNGAYFFEKLPYETGSVRNWMDDYFTTDNHYFANVDAIPDANPQPPSVREDTEAPENAIMTSEVNNPMTFYAEGYNLVGMGKILGLATQTVALSSGTAFGSQPLIVFSDRGLWAMTVDGTGLYKSSAPLPREVCSNPKSITMTDGAVFFASEKGLMVVAGQEVRCVSEQLRGRVKDGLNFHDFLQGAEIGYDYRDGLLWIGRDDSKTLWIYNIKSGTFAHFELDDTPASLSFVNYYPDYLMQMGSTIYSFMERPDGNLDGNEYSGTIITRPMKFSNAMALKSIREIRNVSDMEGTLTFRLFASNTLKADDWRELKSLRGIPHKYYKIRFDFAGMKATDRFSGTVIVTQERRTNKLR